MKPSVQGIRTLCVAVGVASALAACGGSQAGRATTPGKNTIGVEAAALPSRVLRAKGGTQVAEATFYNELAKADAICIGESHRNPHHHWVQLQILGRLSKAQKARGVMVGLGMEMFQRPYQGVLDDFVAGRISEKAMLSRTGWEDRWGFDYGLYSPMVRMARKRGLPILALNTARELVKKVSRKGLSKLTDADRKRLPELVLDDKEHRAWFDALMSSMGGAHGHQKSHPHGKKKQAHGHGHGHKKDPGEESMADRIYSAQVLWDETMADTAAKWLAKGPNRQIIVLAGNGHCHTSAIVRRLARRGPKTVVSIQPIIDDGEGNVAKELASPINDYLFVMSHDDD